MSSHFLVRSLVPFVFVWLQFKQPLHYHPFYLLSNGSFCSFLLCCYSRTVLLGTQLELNLGLTAHWAVGRWRVAVFCWYGWLWEFGFSVCSQKGTVRVCFTACFWFMVWVCGFTSCGGSQTLEGTESILGRWG